MGSGILLRVCDSENSSSRGGGRVNVCCAAVTRARLMSSTSAIAATATAAACVEQSISASLASAAAVVTAAAAILKLTDSLFPCVLPVVLCVRHGVHDITMHKLQQLIQYVLVVANYSVLLQQQIEIRGQARLLQHRGIVAVVMLLLLLRQLPSKLEVRGHCQCLTQSTLPQHCTQSIAAVHQNVVAVVFIIFAFVVVVAVATVAVVVVALHLSRRTLQHHRCQQNVVSRQPKDCRK